MPGFSTMNTEDTQSQNQDKMELMCITLSNVIYSMPYQMCFYLTTSCMKTRKKNKAILKLIETNDQKHKNLNKV
ncbi:hypothetical protein BpHYR1_002986 [Brachionus plicatilis]|uniref:Uncharacterized protein n=1 Tax=Brachionus plicatilis TaxID=10195 RepID=A0A3M7RU65_BRAPC|nr:hypothetical protein BpHYR1_002986 [Brachionus plicatilis]